VDRFFAELDAGRDFCADAPESIVNSLLKHIAGPGFKEFAERHDIPFESAAEYRQRYLIDAVAGTLKGIFGGK
jgi:hypothetical protein